LHDNIGAQLTFIISSIDNLKYAFKIPDKLGEKLKNISEFTSTTIYELRDTIWAMNKSEITFEDLQIRISNFIEKANIASQNVEFNFNVTNSVDKSASFTSLKGMNIYRIIQEGLNNALKYSNASQISVNIDEEDGKMSITILDDGIGFEKDKIKFGNGLLNMQKRAADINASISIDSMPSSGTRISIKF
jgi:signal transduction histidine kinase